MTQNVKIISITRSAAIAAIYVVLTMLANYFGLANYVIQVRFSEALTILPFFTPDAVLGLFVGCLVSNILTNCMPLDVVFGSLATLIGALGTYFVCGRADAAKQKGVLPVVLAPVFPIVSNTVIVPFVLAYVYKFEGSIPYFMLTVGAGEVISCGVLGLLLLKALKPYRYKVF